MSEGGLLMCFWGVVEVDEAVRRGEEKDPMGGRGRSGCIGEMLEGEREREKGEGVLESAV